MSPRRLKLKGVALPKGKYQKFSDEEPKKKLRLSPRRLKLKGVALPKGKYQKFD